ncbi:MAG TPA: hypothetical protein PKM65_20255 [Spirochaetota bacterium]|nr:hypothetical protein [Spirochaetota bacterium]
MMKSYDIDGLREFAFDLLKARDISKLVKKQIVTKRGHKMTVYVRPGKKLDGGTTARKDDAPLDKETWEKERKIAYRKLDAMRDALNAMKPGAEGRDAIKQKATELSASMSRNGFFSTYDDYANNFQKRQWIKNRSAKPSAPAPVEPKPKKSKKEKIYQLKPEDLKPIDEKKGRKPKAVTVRNLSTGETQTFSGITPEQAVVAAHEASQGRKNTSDYDKKLGDVKRGSFTVSMGDWAALKKKPTKKQLAELKKKSKAKNGKIRRLKPSDLTPIEVAKAKNDPVNYMGIKI